MCRKAAKTFGKDTNCNECIPKLQQENTVPAKIYQRVHNQHIFGPAGPVDIRHDALWKWIDQMQVHEEDKGFCFDLVCAAYRNYIGAVREKQERERANITNGHPR